MPHSSSLSPAARRFTAEWEPQDGVLMAWPHSDTDWADCLDDAQATFAAIIRAITAADETVLLAVPPGVDPLPTLRRAGVATARVQLFHMPTNDTWARDFGPITVEHDGAPTLLDFGFNGWGLKFAANHDNQITRRLHDAGAFGVVPLETLPMVLEGGSLESDGAGTLLTTRACLLEGNRNPWWSREEVETRLREFLGVQRILWLEHGALAGDDTDSHVDTLARLAPGDTVVYQACDDPHDEHFSDLSAMAKELGELRTAGGAPYRLLPLPWPAARFDEDGQRLPATYANYLVINDHVLVPTYQCPHQDAVALEVLRDAFPRRTVVGIDCSVLIRQHGSLHCVTMQLPCGTVVAATPRT